MATVALDKNQKLDCYLLVEHALCIFDGALNHHVDNIG